MTFVNINLFHKEHHGQNGQAADRCQQSQAEDPPMSGYAKAAEADCCGEAREEDSHGRTERQDHPRLVFFPLTPAVQDNDAIFYSGPDDEGNGA